MAIFALNLSMLKGASRGFRVKSLAFSTFFMSESSKTRGFRVIFIMSCLQKKLKVKHTGTIEREGGQVTFLGREWALRFNDIYFFDT